MRNVWVVFSFLLLSVQSSFGWSPLLGSKWAEHHPKQLPVSRCFLSEKLDPDRKDSRISGVSVGIGVIAGSFFHSKYVFCLSDALKLAYALPIEDFNVYSVISAGIPTGFSGDLELDARSMDEKSLNHMYSWFS